jgi:hypothetical protein
MDVRCPSCGSVSKVSGLAELPTFPFCSDRCRLVDLGKWMEGSYRFSRPIVEDDLSAHDLDFEAEPEDPSS